MGLLEVELLRPGGGTSGTGQFRNVRYMSPFMGVTDVDYNTETNDYNNTQKSYGMWMVPPDPGATVIVFFIDGNSKYGYWIGCVPDENMNFMIPGIASTSNVVESGQTADVDGRDGRVPVAEYNKSTPENDTSKDSTTIKKPEHPLKAVLDTQGLLLDDIRGITSSSARREIPSMVFGISTPGPLDKSDGAKRGTYGKNDSEIPNAPVSRLGGSTFVMDDGDDKFIRRTSASEGPPDYAAVEQGETDGNVKIPHNELIRIRTRTGHQILMHNSEDLIYVTNARGTTWIELTSDGKIDIYAQDSISIHTENDLNVTADRDINFTAGRNINMNAATNINQQAGSAFNLKSGSDAKINPGGDFHVLAANTAIDGGNINLNSGVASAADTSPKSSRIPMTEPWAGHENLDPTNHKPDKTEAIEEPKLEEPKYFKKYTTVTDTFNKTQGAQ